MYYAWAVDCTILTALSIIASQQTTETQNTEDKVRQLLNYLATRPDKTIRFYASSRILNIHSNASYLSESKKKKLEIGNRTL